MIPALLAPLLGAGLNLVANAVKAKGKKFVEDKVGIKLTPDLSDEALVKLKQFEMEHEEELLKIQVDNNQISAMIDEMYLNDRQDARSLQKTAYTTGDRFTMYFVNIFALLLCTSACVYIGAITFGHVPENNVRFADTILGFILGSILSSIIGFYFGSSRSSQSKDIALKDALQKLGDL
jgi:hypothetical protein